MTGDAESDQDFIRSAIDEMVKRSHEMQDALTHKDHEAWRLTAHRFKGVAATLGFTTLADQFRNAEHHTNTDSERTAALIRIHQLIDLTRAELKKIGMLRPD